MASAFEANGFELRNGLITEVWLRELEGIVPPDLKGAGVRIFDNPRLRQWLKHSSVEQVANDLTGAPMQPVRAILFDKTSTANWAVAWHQDRTIAVRQSADVPGFNHWNEKTGVAHAEPPFVVIERMVTVRVHLDPVNADNSPLVVAPGSHRLGRLAEADVMSAVKQCGTFTCLADRGDVWIYRTAILHSSERSRSTSGRRVLQVDFSSDDLPAPLQWLGIGLVKAT